MTTYYSNACAANVQPRASLGSNTVIGEIVLGSALAGDDVIQMVKIPKGATVEDIIVQCTALDRATGSATALILDVGDADDVDRFIDGSAIGKTGGVDRLGTGVKTGGALGYKYAADSTINITVATAPNSGQTGTITMLVRYHMEQFN